MLLMPFYCLFLNLLSITKCNSRLSSHSVAEQREWLRLDMDRCLGNFFSCVGLSINQLTTKSHSNEHGREDKSVIALFKTQIYSNRVILFRGFDVCFE